MTVPKLRLRLFLCPYMVMFRGFYRQSLERQPRVAVAPDRLLRRSGPTSSVSD